MLLLPDDGLSGGLNARAIRVDRALAAQHDPALRLLARAENLRQVRAVLEPRPLSPDAIGREFRDQYMVGLGEETTELLQVFRDLADGTKRVGGFFQNRLAPTG